MTAFAGMAGGVYAVFVPWLGVHGYYGDRALRQWMAGDTSPYDLNELTTGIWVYVSLGLLSVLAFAAAARRTWLRRTAGILTLPVCALSVLATLNTVGTIRWWGGSRLIDDDLLDDPDHFFTLTTADHWAIAAALLLTLGTVVVTLAGAVEPRLTNDQVRLRAAGYRD
ncbi:hypothetical protein GCM10009760_51290 [Kitasatospora kazusensis]|uniref:DUF3995 domain-containing protein n=1 Tax=Kitasatospora kazusensis TaxID=407974 RepID=A0ABN3A3Z6_9ACTN